MPNTDLDSILFQRDSTELLNGIYSPYLTLLKSLQDLYIFGAGRTGRDLARRLQAQGVKVRAFLDNRQHGKAIDDLPCLSPGEANGDPAIAIATGYQFEIIQQLQAIGRHDYIPYPVLSLWYSLPRELYLSDLEEIILFKKEYAALNGRLADEMSRQTLKAILRYRTTLDPSHLAQVSQASDGQYFDPTIIDISKVKTFVDAGGFDGATTRDFIRCTGGQYDRVFYFEPDPELFKISQAALKGENRICFLNQALAAGPGRATFAASGDMQGHLLGPEADGPDSAVISVECVALDAVVTGGVELIKLDIEGAECDALRGATGILETKPLLAIAYDHSCRDLWRVIDTIDLLCPGYKYYVRHYGGTVTETVLYAVPEKP